ncbi:hypothetical protein VAPA_1c44420 [Variovorax paradoxus B4]|uniref:Transmembrane protein n=1 Tax=Variovorax paradoxus B4 TaxID=1246301 RepID=T1XHB4_VARPD|nr:hypothetical protein [Variovorax paradoxus]AGU51515.1 hypothetical protein VAPA_1c44420 [Variovorax paradoxus B4]
MTWLFIQMIDRPKTVMFWGRLFVNVGGLACIAGLWGQLAVKATSELSHPGPASPPTRTLAELYPSLPIWWIPESAFGYALAIGVAALGIWLVTATKRMNRSFR